MNTEDILHEIAKQSGGEYREWDTGRAEGPRESPTLYTRRNFLLQTPTRSVRDVLELPAEGTAMVDEVELGTERKRLEMIILLAKEGIASAPEYDVNTRIARMTRIIDYCIANGLPMEQHFCGTTEEIRRLTDWTVLLGSSAAHVPQGFIEDVTVFEFGGFSFYYHAMDKLPAKDPNKI